MTISSHCVAPLRRALLLVSLGLSISSVMPAQRRTGTIQVLVAPDHSDWKYSAGEKVTFLIRAIRDGNVIKGLPLTYRVGL